MHPDDGEYERLCGSLLARHERERAGLARELHDRLGGVLTAARMDLSWLQQRLPAAPDDLASRVAALDAGLAEAMNLKRQAVETLRPALLDHFGLPAALRHLFETACAAAGTQLSAVLPDNVAGLAGPAAVGVFRVAQEALASLVARPGSAHVDVVLEADGDLRLSIEDDNPGAAGLLVEARREGVVAAMQARLRHFGGRVDVATPAGLSITLAMPLVVRR